MPGRLRLTLALLVVAAAVAVVLALLPPPPAPRPSVSAPALAAGGTGLGRFVVTARWGQPAAASTTSPTATASRLRWDGALRLDCGRIEHIEAIGMELADPDQPDAAWGEDGLSRPEPWGAGDRAGFRSATREGWDGVRAVVVACREAGDGGSRLSIETAQRTFSMRLHWSANAFVALPIGDAERTLEVHVMAELDPARRDGSRISAGEHGPVALQSGPR